MIASPVPDHRPSTGHPAVGRGLTLHDVLELVALRGVVRDCSGVNLAHGQPVRWASVLSHAELNSARADEMVLSTVATEVMARDGGRMALGELANRRVAALVLRLSNMDGRMPSSIAATAARVSLPVVAVDESVSLVALADEVNRAITEHIAGALGAFEHVDRRLHHVLAAGAGLSGLIEEASLMIGSPLALLTPLRRIVAAAGFAPGADPRDLVAEKETSQVEVDIQGHIWGLCAGAAFARRSGVCEAVLAALPAIITIEILGFSEALPAVERSRREFVIDLLSGTIRTPGEFAVRGAFVGFSPRPDTHLVGFAMPLRPSLDTDVTAILELEGVPHLCAPLNQDLLVLAEVPDRAAPDRIAQILVVDLLRDESQSGPLIAVGPVTADLGDAGRTVHEARDALTIAQDLQLPIEIVRAESVAIERLFSRLVNDPELAALVDDRLESLLVHDRTHRSQLVRTLDVFFKCGMKRAAAARELGIRRQSVHSRLLRIEHLVGGLDDRENRLALELALRLHRLGNAERTAAHV